MKRICQSAPARFFRRVGAAAVFLGLLACAGRAQAAGEPRPLFYTGFEPSEGYTTADKELPLRGQMGWVGQGSGGTGLVDEFFEGFGQQAFIGYTPPAPKDEYLVLWKPLDLPDPSPQEPVWRFSALMQIVDSTNGQYDEFRWSVYNRQGDHLFSVSFDNATLDILYGLDDDQGFRPTGFVFDNNAVYLLEILINFSRNDWIARLNGAVVVDSQPVSVTGKPLNLGDVDAVWVLTTPGQAGDNFMLFDDYTIEIMPGAAIPPSLEILGFDENGRFQLMVHGERGLSYTLEASSNLRSWTPLETRRLEEGWWKFVDPTAAPVSLYRARQEAP